MSRSTACQAAAPLALVVGDGPLAPAGIPGFTGGLFLTPVHRLHRRLRRRPVGSRRAVVLRAGPGRSGVAPTLARAGCLRFPADRIHKAVVEALVPGALDVVTIADGEGEKSWSQQYSFATGGGRDRLVGRIGFRTPPGGETARLLRQGHALLIKAYYALWARHFAQGGSGPAAPVPVTLSRFCDDLGYARLANGAHRPAAKRQAARVLELLAALELAVEYRAPDGRTWRLEGPVWECRPAGESGRAFTCRPGSWFADAAWQAWNGRVGLAGAGLLELRPDRDRWAICLGGYLAPLARMNGYRPLTLRVRTLLAKSGLSRAERRNPARMREKLERALERLETAGVLGGWDWVGGGGEPDMDAPADLASLAAAATGWADRSLLIRWPPELQAREGPLREARERHHRPVGGRSRARKPKATSD
jgi:hypothetical protein